MENLFLNKTRLVTPTPNYVAPQSTYGKQNVLPVAAVALSIQQVLEEEGVCRFV